MDVAKDQCQMSRWLPTYIHSIKTGKADIRYVWETVTVKQNTHLVYPKLILKKVFKPMMTARVFDDVEMG